MFPPKQETPAGNSTSLRSPFSFTMGPLTIYPLFLLPLIFWISPISATTTATAREDVTPDKDLKLHTGYTNTQPILDQEDNDLKESSFYANQPMNLQVPQQKDRFYSPAPMGYYPYFQSPYQSMFGYPYASPNTFSSPYASMNPFLPQPQYMPNYQSHFYDPYVQLMHLTQPPKYQQGYPSSYPQSSQFSPLLSQSPHQFFQSANTMNNPFYTTSNTQGKPFGESQQSIQNDPQTISSSFVPEDAYTLYSSLTPGGAEQVSYQSSSGNSHGQAQTSPSNYQQTISSTSVFSSLSPNTQQLLSSLTSPSSLSHPSSFGFSDKQASLRNPLEDLADIVKNPPPKAIMTTASDILGLRGHTTPTFNFHYSPDANKQTIHRYTNKNGQSQYKRKPPVLSFNNMSNNKQIFGPGGLDLQVPKKYKLKTANETLDPGPDCENCEDPNPNYISEPVISASVLTSPHGGIDEYIEAVLAKTKKLSASQPHNILPDDEPVPVMHGTNSLDEEPTFVAEEADEDFFSNREPVPDSDKKSQLYRCPTPMSRDLREISQVEIYPDPVKCDQFYYCKSGRAYIFKCPVNHAFNSYTNVCERDEDFACAMVMGYGTLIKK